MRAMINKISRQDAADRIASPVSLLGLENAGRAGAQKHTYPRPSETRRRLFHRLRQAILGQAHLRKAIIAAVELAKIVANPHLVDIPHLADPCVEVDAFKLASCQSAALAT